MRSAVIRSTLSLRARPRLLRAALRAASTSARPGGQQTATGSKVPYPPASQAPTDAGGLDAAGLDHWSETGMTDTQQDVERVLYGSTKKTTGAGGGRDLYEELHNAASATAYGDSFITDPDIVANVEGTLPPVGSGGGRTATTTGTVGSTERATTSARPGADLAAAGTLRGTDAGYGAGRGTVHADELRGGSRGGSGAGAGKRRLHTTASAAVGAEPLRTGGAPTTTAATTTRVADPSTLDVGVIDHFDETGFTTLPEDAAAVLEEKPLSGLYDELHDTAGIYGDTNITDPEMMAAAPPAAASSSSQRAASTGASGGSSGTAAPFSTGGTAGRAVGGGGVSYGDVGSTVAQHAAGADPLSHVEDPALGRWERKTGVNMDAASTTNRLMEDIIGGDSSGVTGVDAPFSRADETAGGRGPAQAASASKPGGGSGFGKRRAFSTTAAAAFGRRSAKDTAAAAAAASKPRGHVEELPIPGSVLGSSGSAMTGGDRSGGRGRSATTTGASGGGAVLSDTAAVEDWGMAAAEDIGVVDEGVISKPYTDPEALAMEGAVKEAGSGGFGRPLSAEEEAFDGHVVVPPTRFGSSNKYAE